MMKQNNTIELRNKIIKNLNTVIPRITLKANINLKHFDLIKNKKNICVLIKDISDKKYFAKIFLDNQNTTEVLWLKKAHKYKLPVPKLIYLDNSQKEIPFKYEILEFITGNNTLYELSQEHQYIIARHIGYELKNLHKISVNGFGIMNEEGKWTKKTWVDTLKDYMRLEKNQKIVDKLITKKEVETINEQTIHNKKINIKKPKLIHGDVCPNNFIYSPKYKNQVVFIDPGRIIGGDPMFDLAYAKIPQETTFYNGLKTGYELKIQLTKKELYRIDKLKIVCLLSATIGYYNDNKDYKKFLIPLKKILTTIT